MSYCIECGHALPDDAKFCANCGKRISNANSNNENKRETVFAGKIYKCPNCGETINSFFPYCNVCGFEFRSMDVCNSVKEFYAILSDVATEEQRMFQIKNFPIPNTKEDIVEFMMIISANITIEISPEQLEVWKSKLDQVFEKSRIVLKNSSEFDQIENLYNNIQKQILKIKQNQKKIKTARRFSNIYDFVCDMLKIFLPFIGRNLLNIVGIFLIFFAKERRHEDFAIFFELLGLLLMVITAISLLKRSILFYSDILTCSALGVVLFIVREEYDYYLPDEGMFVFIVGVLLLCIAVVAFFRKLINYNTEKGE